MDYIGKKCPVCHHYFHADDDIVVCPECGTPHHRECYEQTGHCCNEHLHAEGFDYNASPESEENKGKICPKCGKSNLPENFFCSYCGASLTQEKQENPSQNQQNTNAQGFPFGMGGMGGNAESFPFLDPLGGVPGETDLGDGVTAGEAAKYVKQNTPYFIRIFSNIKSFAKSKFNFAAALLPGGYMLYRKMYKIGAFFTFLDFALMIFYKYLYFYIINMESMKNSNYSLSSLLDPNTFTNSDMAILYLYELIFAALVAIRIVSGICFNRMYFKHCKKQIIAIKSNAKEGENPETLLQTKGGVNLPLMVSIYISYLIVYYLPYILMSFI